MNRAERRAAARDAVGEFISLITDPKTGESIATIRRLPEGLLAVDVEGDDALVLMQPFLPKTMTGVKLSACGEKQYRFVYINPTEERGP
jgi:hypothetical protein